MASQNERQRWERAWEQMQARMERQRNSITRLVAINTEAMAALEEIAAIGQESHRVAEWEAAAERASARAGLALDRIKGSAAPKQVESVDSIEEATPIEDPRRRH